MHASSHDMIQSGGDVRVLGCDSKGRAYLGQVKHDLTLPLITKVNDQTVTDDIQMDFRSGMLIQMITGVSQDFYRHPIIIEK